ncbi:zinc finger BED domain-containing protein RICESLEEPER 1-like [Panicum virgatum]|uniref:zinc finger BED domain-containing protein RICESLEEPER 1-like n=1 Tax=Panicum virgatum TaxID=38727 RepID=UPI0019D6AA27|nr:zinc finger BED domain-containing protein RICESLEEPER 1-like [Panicum virgatum]XP_039838921.1 zinc finger BED domain-containing protein RICESLEEPER 1-like [Panicum virgatum]
MFKEIIAQEGITCKKKTGLDVVTRWNSTLSMLQTALKYSVAFEKLKSEDQKYTYAPSSDEWEKAAVLCRLLQVFNGATGIVSGSQYSTSNLYFHEMWKIKLALEQESSIEDAEIATVLKAMKKKFNKYWNKSYVLLCVLVIFDPRYKLKFIDFVFSQSFGTKAKQRFHRVESLVRELFQAYSSKGKESDLPSMSHLGSTNHKVPSMKTDPWAAWDRQLSHDLQSQMTTELDRYLDETAVPRSAEFDILKWWMGNAAKYPTLACIARDLLAIPASSVASESAFSTSKKKINDFHSSLLPETVEALICTQDWFREEGKKTEFSMSSINDLIMREDNT